MHQVKTRARQTAWSNSANPFGHQRPANKRSLTSDLERGTNPEALRQNSDLSAPQQTRSYPTSDRADSISRANVQPQGISVNTNAGPSAVPYVFGNGEKQGEDFTPATSETLTQRTPSDTINRMGSMPNKEVNYAEGNAEDRGFNDGEKPKKGIFGFLKRRKKGSNSEVQNGEGEDSKSKKHFGLWPQLKAAVFGSYVNILLVCVPVGIALHYTSVDPKIAFVINFIAIIPLAGILSYATEEIALRVGETLGGLLNASFGNAVELIVSIIALAKDEILIVKTSLIGSMLSNLLLVLGMCFFAGGFNRKQQFFNVTVAQTASSLLALAVGSLIIPTVFADWANDEQSPDQLAEKAKNVAPLSRATAVLLLVVYACYLFFQLKSHADMYNEKSEKAPIVPLRKKHDVDTHKGIAAMGAGSAAIAGGSLINNDTLAHPQTELEEDDAETSQLSLIGSIVTLCVATALVGICAEFMVDGISAITKTGKISPEFVGLILIPIVGNAAEHATAVTVALKDKMDLAIGVCVGSSMQISLLVLPLVVVIGWIMGKHDMDLNFDGFQIAILFVAILLVNYLIQDGKSHWLEGVMLMVTYLIIAVAAWFYPASTDVVG